MKTSRVTKEMGCAGADSSFSCSLNANGKLVIAVVRILFISEIAKAHNLTEKSGSFEHGM